MGELVTTRKFRGQIPKEHRESLDTRVLWLWNQRYGTVQQVWNSSPDMLDKTAATMFLQAFMAQDLEAITLIFARIEGGAIDDERLLDRQPKVMRI